MNGIARERYHQLQRLAGKAGRPTWELLELYALEGLLARLAASPHHASLVLKGGMLLAAFDTRRPTRDIDLQARPATDDAEILRRWVERSPRSAYRTAWRSTPRTCGPGRSEGREPARECGCRSTRGSRSAP